MSDDCVFCKIVRKEIPSVKIYEDEVCYCFLDIQPINKGHALVIPKAHSESIYTLPESDLLHCAKVIQKVAKGLKDAVRCDGLNVGMNNGRAAGQVVFHAHFHVIPRFLSDGLTHWPGKKMDAGQLAMLGTDIKASIERMK